MLGGGLRETQFVPTYEEQKEEDDGFFKVYHDKDHGKMMTIKEEDEDKRSNGSDTAYFSPEHEHDFNDRDDDDNESMYQKRIQMLVGMGISDDDEDHQPYDFEEEERR